MNSMTIFRLLRSNSALYVCLAFTVSYMTILEHAS